MRANGATDKRERKGREQQNEHAAPCSVLAGNIKRVSAVGLNSVERDPCLLRARIAKPHPAIGANANHPQIRPTMFIAECELLCKRIPVFVVGSLCQPLVLRPFRSVLGNGDTRKHAGPVIAQPGKKSRRMPAKEAMIVLPTDHFAKRAMISEDNDKQKWKKKRQPANHAAGIVKADCGQYAARQKNEKKTNQILFSEAHPADAMQLRLAGDKEDREAKQLTERRECLLAGTVERRENGAR